MGIDMLDNVVLDSIYVYQGGRQWAYGGGGGAGIGIGTGLWENENAVAIKTTKAPTTSQEVNNVFVGNTSDEA